MSTCSAPILISMSDREMLEFAAKAAGISIHHWENGVPMIVELFRGHLENYFEWNPINDDGDRYRMAKRLDIRIHFGPCYVTYVVDKNCRVLRWPEDVKDDAYAIVQAAAEIAQSMK